MPLSNKLEELEKNPGCTGLIEAVIEAHIRSSTATSSPRSTFLMTGFHAIHVIVGLILFAIPLWIIGWA